MNLWKKALAVAVVCSTIGLPQPACAQHPLDQYISEGLKSNLVLQQKNISLEKAALALKTAGTYFMPAISFNGSYTSGRGGRAIAIPVGDMLNPVYATLNELTRSNNFPQIDNVEQTFFPNNFYDARLRTTLPLLNTDLHHNRSLQQHQVVLQDYELRVYARELVNNIKAAYYQYLSAQEAVHIYASARQLLEQNLAVNQSLLRNGKALPAMLLRLQSELETVKAQHQEAQNTVLNARHYFNFLLNKAADAPVEGLPAGETDLQPAALPAPADIDGREELEMIRTGDKINQTLVRMNRQFWVPKVNAFLDLGSQAEDWRFNSQSRYYLAGLSLDVPVFHGGRHQYKIRQSLLEAKANQLQLAYTSRQLALAADVARNQVHNAYQNYTASRDRLRAASSYFKLMERGYKEGTSSMIEYLDGRNQLTEARLQVNINTYRVLAALAAYERETAAFGLPF